MMNQRSIIDIERHLANPRERVFAIFVIENPHVSCDQPAKWVQREAANICFDPVFMQFLNDSVAPFAAKSPPREVITAPANANYSGQNRQTHEVQSNSAPPHSLPITCGAPNLWRFENRRHQDSLKR